MSVEEKNLINKETDINTETISKQNIEHILNTNTVTDLKRYLKKRTCLNECNIGLTYGFHLLQTCGVILTSLSSTYKINELLWIGIGCNSIASLIIIYEKINKNISNKLLDDIKLIKEGNYIDEQAIINIDTINSE